MKRRAPGGCGSSSWLAGAASVVVLLLLPGAASAAVDVEITATTPDQFSIVDAPEDDPGGALIGAKSTTTQVEDRARQDSGIRAALARRSGAQLELTFVRERAAWVAEVRQRASAEVLASVELADGSLDVLESFQLPLGDYPPRLTEREAIDAAVEDRVTRRVAKQFGGVGKLRASGRLDECCWEVDLFDPKATGEERDTPVMRVGVRDDSSSVVGVWTGHQIAWKMARGERRAFGGDVNDPWIWLPMFVIFAMVAIDWTRLRSWWTTDVAALLALGLSHEMFLRGQLDWSVPMALPPLLWLLGRMLVVFTRGLPVQQPAKVPRTRVGRLVLRRVPTIALVVLCVVLAGLRIGVTLDGGNVIDVGYAGLAGARLELKGEAPWGNMPADNPHGDTYGPVNYAAYVPAALLLDEPDDDWGGDLPAAQATAIAADLLCALLLAAIGWRWISRRGGVLLAAGWLACPWTFWALASGVNDALVAVPLLAAFALLRRPTLRGALVGAAVLIKIAPLAALAPLLHVGTARRVSQALRTGLAAVVVILAGIAWAIWRINDGSPTGIVDSAQLLWQRTVGFQAERGSPFSPWGLYELPTLQGIAQGLVALGVLVACLRPRVRSAWQVAAGIAALLIAVQLVVTHWFYLYIPWFLGFTLLVLVAARERPVPSQAASEPALVP
ncbi:MAG: hypothetical protein JWM90_2324 [Thermoleophilia bacterium]|nr:hypothetical protein [Thermoleophilia bacterium]